MEWSTNLPYKCRPKANWSISTELTRSTCQRVRNNPKVASNSRTSSSRDNLAMPILTCNSLLISNKWFTMTMPSLMKRRRLSSAHLTHHPWPDPYSRITFSKLQPRYKLRLYLAIRSWISSLSHNRLPSLMSNLACRRMAALTRLIYSLVITWTLRIKTKLLLNRRRTKWWAQNRPQAPAAVMITPQAQGHLPLHKTTRLLLKLIFKSMYPRLSSNAFSLLKMSLKNSWLTVAKTTCTKLLTISLSSTYSLLTQ